MSSSWSDSGVRAARHRWGAALLVIGLGVATSHAVASDASSSAPAPSAGAVSLWVTAETGFQPLPCECSTARLGGWAEREATFDSLAAVSAEPVVRLDAGGWLGGGVTDEVAALAASAHGALGYDVLNVGPIEFEFVTRDPGPTRDLPLVSGHPQRPAHVPAWRVVDAGTTRVGVIGVGWFGGEQPRPDAQVQRALSEMPPVDHTIVLCAAGMGPAGLAAAADPRVDLIVYGEGAKTPEPVPMAQAFGVAPGSKGRYVGVATLTPDRAEPTWTLRPVLPRRVVGADMKAVALRAEIRHNGRGALRNRFTYRE